MKKSKSNIVTAMILAAALSAAAFSGCGSTVADAKTITDTNSDTNTNANTVTNANINTNAKANANTDAGTDTDSDLNTGTNVDNNAEINADSDLLQNEQHLDAESYYAKLESCKEQIEQITDFRPEIVLVLGTGFGDYTDSCKIVETIPYKDIKGWPDSTAPDHEGNLVFAEHKGLKLAIMQGRVHYYEGYTMADVVLPLRVLHLLGADTVILTNAVGSMNEDIGVGEYVCVEDHISSFVPSPLIGENIDELGERFTGMTEVYDKELHDTVIAIGKENNIPVHSGVFVQTSGPQFETPAEIRMYRALGADTVGMSTAVEAIAAAHMHMRVCDINCVSNMAAGMEKEDFSSDSINDAMKDAGKNSVILINGLLDSLVK